MKPIYTAPTIEAAEQALQRFADKWQDKYPMSVDSWQRNWDRLSVFFNYPVQIRKVVYTTNAIESLHAQMRKNIRNRKVFPNDSALLKLLFLNIKNFTYKWKKRVGWDSVMNQLAVMFPDRINNGIADNLL